MRIVMWSGPRNLSTALMYAFAGRSDCAVWDEPFYAPFLAATGLNHPMAAQIIAAHETNPAAVAARCAGQIPQGKTLFYQKHMPHHMLPGFPLDWAAGCVNVHLIRHPARVVASYAAKRETVSFADIGFAEQHALWRRLGGPVIESADVRDDPEAMLKALCAAIGLNFDPAMLAWPQGGRPEDGIWAAHWYGAVHRSTGFAGPEGPLPEVTDEAAQVVAQALPIYLEMASARIRTPGLR